MAAHVVSRHPALSAASLPCPHPVPWYLLTAEIHQVLPIETDVAPLEDIVPVGMVEMRGCWEGDDPPRDPSSVHRPLLPLRMAAQRPVQWYPKGFFSCGDVWHGDQCASLTSLAQGGSTYGDCPIGGHIPLWGELVQPSAEHGGPGLGQRGEAGIRGDGEVIQDLVRVEMCRQDERGAFGLWCLHSGVSLRVILDDAVNEPGPSLLVLTPSFTAALTACPVENRAMRELAYGSLMPSHWDVSHCSWTHPELLGAPSVAVFAPP